jgi:hypothetical protein
MCTTTMTPAQSSTAHPSALMTSEPLSLGGRRRAYNRDLYHTGHFATISGEQGIDLAQQQLRQANQTNEPPPRVPFQAMLQQTQDLRMQDARVKNIGIRARLSHMRDLRWNPLDEFQRWQTMQTLS